VKGDGMYEKIINSGIFKLDDKGKPVGMVKLSPQKALSKRGVFIPFKQGTLKQMIIELDSAIKDYFKPLNKSAGQQLLDKVLQKFESEYMNFLATWGIKTSTVNINKAKRSINTNLKKRAQEITVTDQKESARKILLTIKSFNIFARHTTFNKSDIYFYVTCLFNACDIKDTWEAIKQRCKRISKYLPTEPLL
jgi:hypothetical protein